MVILKILFYLFSIPALIMEHNSLINGRRGSDLFKESFTTDNIKDILSNTATAKIFLLRFFCYNFYSVWVLLGLLTFNWWIFALIIFLSFIPKKTE